MFSILSKIAPDVPCFEVERALASNDYMLALLALLAASGRRRSDAEK